MDNQPFSGKTAFVTGAARGIGAAIVKRLAAGGATVAFTYKQNGEAAAALVAAIGSGGGRAIAIHSDAGDADALAAAINRTGQELGKIDILVNNAGVARMGIMPDFSLEDFDLTVALNLRTVFVAVKAVLPYMGEGGRIVNIGSTHAERMPFPGAAAYAMSKAGLVGLTQGLARDLGPRGITVNTVQPGPVNTDANPETGPFAPHLHRMMAVPRHGKPEEVAAMVAYVAGQEAAFVTGASLLIDGGFAA